MRASSLIRVAMRSIVRNKLRSTLTMLGIIIGVAAVLVMVAIGQGAQSQIQAQINSLGTNMIVISPGSSQQGGVSRGAGSFNRLSLDDVALLVRESRLLTAISPVIVAPSQAIGGQGNWRTHVDGVSTDYPIIRNLQMDSGVFFDEDDLRASRKVAVLGSTVADNLFPDMDPVGESIQLRGTPFTIIGVLSRKGQTANGTDQDDVVLAPYTTVKNRLSGHQFLPMILASASSPEDIPAAEAEIRTLLRESHRLAQWEDDDFTVRNQADLNEAAQGTTKVMTLLLAAIAGISLVVGGIGIMNIMLVSVTERTREIGIRMALGARGTDVLTQFLVESTVLSVLGGAAGVGIGFLAAIILGRAMGWSTEVSPPAVAAALVFSGAVGIFFGYYPARRAAALDPIQALRHE